MKKAFLLLAAFLAAGAVTAQSPRPYEKNILGVRAGLNVAYIRASGGTSGSTSPRAGYHIGVSDQILLSGRLPLYVETGVVFSSRGGRFDGVSFRPMYLQVPLLVNYHFNIRGKIALQPFAGIYYGVGMDGKARHSDGWADIFGERGILRRSDLGVRMGVGAVLKRVWFSVGFDLGCLNNLAPGYTGWQYSDNNRYSYNFSALRNSSFTLSVGYNF